MVRKVEKRNSRAHHSRRDFLGWSERTVHEIEPVHCSMRNDTRPPPVSVSTTPAFSHLATAATASRRRAATGNSACRRLPGEGPFRGRSLPVGLPGTRARDLVRVGADAAQVPPSRTKFVRGSSRAPARCHHLGARRAPAAPPRPRSGRRAGRSVDLSGPIHACCTVPLCTSAKPCHAERKSCSMQRDTFAKDVKSEIVQVLVLSEYD